MRRPPSPVVLVVLVLLALEETTGALVGRFRPPVAGAHHVGAYVARDNEVSANFKQIKFSLQAGRFDVAMQLFERGALRKEMLEKSATLPAGLEAGTRAALRDKNPLEVDRQLMLFFAALSRDLAHDADRQLAQAGAPEARCLAGERFLEAIWRYYNLIDFAVSSRSSKTSVEVRLAFDEAESLVKSPATPAASGPCARTRTGSGWSWWSSWWRPDPPAPDKMREPFQRIARALADLIQMSSTSARRNP
jgi:hypothetical protein